MSTRLLQKLQEFRIEVLEEAIRRIELQKRTAEAIRSPDGRTHPHPAYLAACDEAVLHLRAMAAGEEGRVEFAARSDDRGPVDKGHAFVVVARCGESARCIAWYGSNIDAYFHKEQAQKAAARVVNDPSQTPGWGRELPGDLPTEWDPGASFDGPVDYTVIAVPFGHQVVRAAWNALPSRRGASEP